MEVLDNPERFAVKVGVPGATMEGIGDTRSKAVRGSISAKGGKGSQGRRSDAARRTQPYQLRTAGSGFRSNERNRPGRLSNGVLTLTVPKRASATTKGLTL